MSFAELFNPRTIDVTILWFGHVPIDGDSYADANVIRCTGKSYTNWKKLVEAKIIC